MAVIGASLSSFAVSPSEGYFRRARAAYVRPEYIEGTNSVVSEWKIDSTVRADRPSSGDTVRWIDVDGIRNFRDIGGWTGLRTGRAFRGTEADCLPAASVGTNNYHNLGVTEKGVATLREQLRIRTDLDLRKASECPHPDRSPLGVRLVRAPVRPYLELFDTTNAWAAALRTFADARNYPIYFHCWGGADRTGILALLLEGLCGASESDATIDYELTTFGGFPRSRAVDGPAKDMFYEFLKRIRAYPGVLFKDKVEAFLKAVIGLTDEEVAAIRSNLTEETPRVIARRRGATLITKLDWYANGWSPMDYETKDGIKGTLLFASKGSPDRRKIEIPLPARGRYRIILGLCGTRWNLGCGLFVRLSRDPAPVFMDATANTRDAGFWMQPVENEWKTAGLDNDTLVIEKPEGGCGGLAWIRLVPVEDEEARPTYKHDIIATNDGYAPVREYDELLAPIMRLKDSPVSEVHFCVGNGPFAFAVPSKVGIPCTYDESLPYEDDYAVKCAKSYSRLWTDHPNLLDELADFTHALGMRFCVSFRTGCAIDHMRFWEAGRYATPGSVLDDIRRPENYCRLFDGTPVARFSYAKKEVQDWFLRFYSEMLTSKVDGISLLWIRALPAMLFEPAFRERFKKEYGEDLAAEDDPRVKKLRAEIMTEYHRRVRQLAGGRRVVLFIPPTRATCEDFGLDLRRLAEEGLADEFVINYSIQTAFHDESTEWFDFEMLRKATAGTKTKFRACMWGSEGEYTRAVREGAVGLACWDAATCGKPWHLWEQLRLLGDEDGERARAWAADKANQPAGRVHPLKTLNGFDAARYPWHVAY